MNTRQLESFAWGSAAPMNIGPGTAPILGAAPGQGNGEAAAREGGGF
jgi:hypothetical protein